MAIRTIIGITLLVLAVLNPAGAQQGPYFPQGQRPAPMPYAQTPSGQYGTTPAPGYGYQQQMPQHPQTPQTQGNYGSSAGDWPHYQYPQYHNPYYQGTNPREAISGTIDWFFSLPAHLMDRVSNFLDGSVFPQAPATRGPVPRQTGQPQPGQHGAPVAAPGPPPQAPLPQR